MIPSSATLKNSALLVIDVINSCAAEDYEDPERDIHYGRIRRMVRRSLRSLPPIANWGERSCW